MTATLTRAAAPLPKRDEVNNILVIDDLRVFHDLDCQYARNSLDAMNMLHKGEPWDMVFFDHDLGGEDTTNSVLYFLELCVEKGVPIEIRKCIVHTANPVGAERLEKALSKYYNVQRISALSMSNIGTIGE